MRIKQLEEALRTPLLIRQARGLQLTRAGEVVLAHARAVFRQLDCLHADLLPYAEGIKGSIRLMANSTATNTFLADALSPFLREHAAIDIELVECSSEEVTASVVKGVADLGVIAARVQSDELEVLPLYPDELVLIASQDAAPRAARPDPALGGPRRLQLRRPEPVQLDPDLRRPDRAVAGQAGEPADPGQQLRRRLPDGGHRARASRWCRAPARPATT